VISGSFIILGGMHHEFSTAAVESGQTNTTIDNLGPKPMPWPNLPGQVLTHFHTREVHNLRAV